MSNDLLCECVEYLYSKTVHPASSIVLIMTHEHPVFFIFCLFKIVSPCRYHQIVMIGRALSNVFFFNFFPVFCRSRQWPFDYIMFLLVNSFRRLQNISKIDPRLELGSWILDFRSVKLYENSSVFKNTLFPILKIRDLIWISHTP
jgi:hypothetical protein